MIQFAEDAVIFVALSFDFDGLMLRPWLIKSGSWELLGFESVLGCQWLGILVAGIFSYDD